MKWILTAAFLSVISGSAFAAESLCEVNSERSNVGITSVKNNAFAELFTFKKISGDLSARGIKNNGDHYHFNLSLPIESLETDIPIRNQRIITHLFDNDATRSFAISLILDKATLEAAAKRMIVIERAIDIRYLGKSIEKKATIWLQMNQGATADKAPFSAGLVNPVYINLSEFGFIAGLEKLRNIAGLNSIDQVIAVNAFISCQ